MRRNGIKHNEKNLGSLNGPYTSCAIADVEVIEGMGKRLPTKVTTLLLSGYMPELDQGCKLKEGRWNNFKVLFSFLH